MLEFAADDSFFAEIEDVVDWVIGSALGSIDGVEGKLPSTTVSKAEV